MLGATRLELVSGGVRDLMGSPSLLVHADSREGAVHLLAPAQHAPCIRNPVFLTLSVKDGTCQTNKGFIKLAAILFAFLSLTQYSHSIKPSCYPNVTCNQGGSLGFRGFGRVILVAAFGGVPEADGGEAEGAVVALPEALGGLHARHRSRVRCTPLSPCLPHVIALLENPKSLLFSQKT